MSTNSTDMSDYCKKILALDPKIRFAGKIVDEELVSTARKDGVIPLLDKDLAALAHHQVSVKAMMDKMFTDKLGNTDWIVESKGKVKLLTIFQKDGILILSTEPTSDHHSIIEKIKNLK
ncbi:MAG TPA: hypothetical protein VFV16_03880 [Candidatus Nitrosotalea sp.]|jgi:hypothetical protein|nr:hypothetical protein [Candidatus Nitrosotalea sp.]HET7336974.1 hypothetical protein [Candidatus Nitrosotalea sp.]HEU5487944.1 hypothetical protein [Candidatus Nitrosotalea sp.]